MSDEQPGPTHSPYGESDPHAQTNPYGQSPDGQAYPSGQQPAYGQPAYGQPSYGQPGHVQPAYGQVPAGDRRPGTVTAAAWITIVFSAVATVLFAIAAAGLLIARDDVIAEMEKVQEFRDADIDADAALGAIVAVVGGLVLWALIAIVLAIFVLRRSNVARILLVISSAVVVLFSLISVGSGVSVVTLVAAAATIVLLFVGGAGDWFKGVSSSPGGYSGGPTGYPQGQYGDPYGQQPPSDGGTSYPSSDYPGR